MSTMYRVTFGHEGYEQYVFLANQEHAQVFSDSVLNGVVTPIERVPFSSTHDTLPDSDELC